MHGHDQVERAERASRVLFGDDLAGLSADEVLTVFEDVPSTTLGVDRVEGDGIALVDLLVMAELAASKSDARRLVQSGGVYVNNRRASDPQARVTRTDAIEGRLIVLRKGQKQNHLVRLT